LAAVVAVALWWSGYLLPVFGTDESRLTYAIAGLFVVAWVWVLKEVLATSLALNALKLHGPSPAPEACRDKDLAKIEWLSSVSEWLVALGLLGTVVGFSMALSGIDQGAVSNASGAQSAVTALMQGMRIALNTTLLGAALALWHEVNVRMLRTALAVYWADRIAAAAQAGGAIASRALQPTQPCEVRRPAATPLIQLSRSNGAGVSPQ
jgi:hypothetical protein